MLSEMKKMNDVSEPLYGRFQLSINLKPFDYLDSSAFYETLSPYEKIGFYAVFGGYPFALDYIEPGKGLRWNIENILLDTKGYVYTSLRYALLKEIFKIETAESILLVLGNGKARNSEIASSTSSSAASVSLEIRKLMEMEIVSSTFPINRHKDEKKTFYEISDNLLRFFYAYILPNENEIELRGPSTFYKRFIEPSLPDFIARRFEHIIPEYLRRLIRLGKADDILDIGTYWYDDKKRHRNGEFDCAVSYGDGYDIFEMKHLSAPMDRTLADAEIRKIQEIGAMNVKHIGFVSLEGFSFTDPDYILISGNELFSPELETPACRKKHDQLG